jgi:hypothetical protein
MPLKKELQYTRGRYSSLSAHFFHQEIKLSVGQLSFPFFGQNPAISGESALLHLRALARCLQASNV